MSRGHVCNLADVFGATEPAPAIEPVTTAKAEALVGRKLDRRRSYAWDGETLFERYAYSTFCSGCICDCGDGYPCSHDPNGCHECGYTGKRRHVDWWPHEDAQQMRQVDAEFHGSRKVGA